MVEIENVTRVFHRGETQVHALRGVTARMEKGSFNFVVGPSGSGKSSLLYLIGALDSPSSGDIRVSGRSLNAFSLADRDNYRREEVGIIFQSFNLLGNLSAVDNVLVPFMPTGVSALLRNEAVQLLERVGLGDRLTHRPNHLSGGEQQRVAIARALLKKPQLVLADEPTGELDSKTGEEVFGYLRQLHEEHNTTVIVVTHDESYMVESDCILQMKDGRAADLSVGTG
jgi:putative ABC transport system ATP-binding protein